MNPIARMKRGLATAFTALAALPAILATAPTAAAQAPTALAPTEQAGRLVIEGEASLPLLRSHYDVAVDGDVASVTVTQTFLNPTARAVDATYLFPLGTGAAVTAMEMRMDDRTVHAVIRRKGEAEQMFETAKQEGKAAALLTQHRPNMFTQSVANLMPGQPVTIVLRYARGVPRIDGAFELAIPTVVGPRYEGALPAPAPLPAALDDLATPDEPLPGQWQVEPVPAYPPVIGHQTPSTVDPRRLTLSLTLRAPSPITQFQSFTHELAVTGDGQTRRATFVDGPNRDNRDFVLRYGTATDRQIGGGTVATRTEKGGFVSLMIEPPRMPARAGITPRELVFVVDTSGSMSGAPMETARHFMDAALRGLRPSDTFRILSFANTTHEFAARAVPATASNVKAGRRHVAGLHAGGGTEMNRAITAAFDRPATAGAKRIVVFLTDGYIGADREVIASLARVIGDDRVYAFGIGSSVNRFLLEGMAREGRGYLRIVEPGEAAHEVAETLARDLKTPLLTDIAIDWNGLDVTAQSPARMPDLFAGGSVRVLARYDGAERGDHLVHIEGMVNGKPARMPIRVSLPEHTASAPSALPAMWAREQIAELERRYTIKGEEPAVKEAIVALGLEFGLQSAFTSFVAVATERVNPNRDPSTPQGAVPETAVPLPQALHVPNTAYPSLGLAGSSTPEPHIYAGMALAFLLTLLAHAKRLRRRVFGRMFRPRAASIRLPEVDGVPCRLARDGWWLSPAADRP